MAKKKKVKSEENESFQYSAELIGLILILIGLIGFGFGVVGSFIKKFAMFLVGEWWPIILVFILFLGATMIFSRKKPKFFSQRFIGFYLLFLVILILSHYTFIKTNLTLKAVLEATKVNYMERIATISGVGPILSSGQASISIGGGFIGAIFAGLFVQLFSLIGTIIVVVAMGIVGIILLFNLNFSEIVNSIKDFFSKDKLVTEEDETDDEDDEEEDTEDLAQANDNKVVITSVEELKNHPAPAAPIASTPVTSDVQTSNNLPYNLPPITLLDLPKKDGKVNSNDFIRSNKTILERVLKEFGIIGQVVEIHIGPAVTQYEMHIQAGTKVSRIVSLNKEIALALAAKDVRIEAPIPGKNTIGIEIPNQVISPVKIREVLGNIPDSQKHAHILVSLGKDIMGRVQTADISKMPHLLVAGATGSGKSVCINSFIGSILMQYRPDEVKLVLIDPKKVELSNYNGVPHLLCPVVTDPKKASAALQKIVSEMEKRYNIFEDKKVKNIGDYNDLIDKENNKHPEAPEHHMPYIVVIIDELADLMVVASKEVEDSIMRITQMARAAGIHLIVATQRPSTDVITGVVKANIPSRISFAVSSQIDSRTILDHAGAEKLLGKGDMLYLPMGENAPIRIQGCFISDDEIRRLIEFVCKEQMAQYDTHMMEEEVDDHNPVSGDAEDYEDPLYDQIVEFAVQTGKVSASLLQRRFRLGYNRAARVVDLLEERGIVGPQNGSKPREVLVKVANQNNEENDE
jgi:DNA segregation ATPase FtsK/SpoIIIE, S-DNA-T family